MDETYIYLCEPSLEGILTAVYQAYEEHHGHDNNRIQIVESSYNQELFATYVNVKTDFEKASKVAQTIQKKVSEEVYESIQKASASHEMRRADAIYRVIVLALKMGAKVLNYLTEPNVICLMELERQVINETMSQREFLRFEELANGVLFARINPKCAVLPYLAEHFSDRFSGENWVIADTVHNGVLIHEKNRGCSLSRVDDVDLDAFMPETSQDEKKWQELWKMFVDTIAIKERINPKLQQQMLPLRFRKYMKDFSS